MSNQWGTHADALSMLLRLRANSDQFTSERSGGVSRGAHGVVVSKRNCAVALGILIFIFQ